jgi:RNA polymerase sigma-70 factor (sigma-E family)
VSEAIDEEFSEYVAARRRALIRTAYVLTGDHHAAEDLVQTALARTYLAWNRIRDKQALDAYVRRAIVNEHTSWWRRAWKRLEHSTDDLPNRPAAEPELDSVERRELRQLVDGLPPRQRVAVVLRYFDGLTEAETAEVMNCSVGTVKSRTSRALTRLRNRYAHATSVPEVGGAQ